MCARNLEILMYARFYNFDSEVINRVVERRAPFLLSVDARAAHYAKLRNLYFSCDCSEAWSDDSMVYTSLILAGLCKDPSAPNLACCLVQLMAVWTTEVK